jgi:hypothetical protein
MLNPSKLLLVSAAAIALVGCGLPAGIPSVSTPSEIVADAGHGGARSAVIDLRHAFATQAQVHRWERADVVEYHVTLAELKTGSSAQVAGDESFQAAGYADAKTGGLSVRLSAAQSKARFTGLLAGRQYAAFIVVKGRKNGTADPLSILNHQQGYRVPGQVIDFTGAQDVENFQTISATLTLDDVLFAGTGDVTIDEVVAGGYTDPIEPVDGAPVN